MKDISSKQVDVLMAFYEYEKENGVGPTLEEVAEMVGLNSHSATLFHVKKLRKLGYMTVKEGKYVSNQITPKGYKFILSKLGK